MTFAKQFRVPNSLYSDYMHQLDQQDPTSTFLELDKENRDGHCNSNQYKLTFPN